MKAVKSDVGMMFVLQIQPVWAAHNEASIESESVYMCTQTASFAEYPTHLFVYLFNFQIISSKKFI